MFFHRFNKLNHIKTLFYLHCTFGWVCGWMEGFKDWLDPSINPCQRLMDSSRPLWDPFNDHI